MKILINCSNQHQGGAIQVINSICSQLNRFPKHQFVVVLSEEQKGLCNTIETYQNVTCYIYSVKDTLWSVMTGRNYYLDKLVRCHNIDIVFTIFGIARWRPKCPHLCGFARAQLILKDSPYFRMIGIKEKILFKIQEHLFRRDANYYYTENPLISEKLPSILQKGAKVFTVTNYYNQIYDHPEKWDRQIRLPIFKGLTILTIGIPYRHKNFNIIPQVASYFLKNYPDFTFRFVVTADRDDFEIMSDEIADNLIFLGKIPFESCPYLYSQSDMMFMPSLLECFTATYPESMKMGLPIVTVDLDYARGLCGKAACYYSALDAKAAAEAIIKVATDRTYTTQLKELGKKQLSKYDNYEQRTEKLVRIMEDIYTECASVNS